MDLDDTMFTRELELESCNTILTFLQKKEGDVSCVVWDAAIVLAKYLDTVNKKNKDSFKGKKILELGTGLGCAGLTAACLGADTVLTDLENTLPLLEKNVKINEKHWKALGGSAHAQVLQWGKEVKLDFKPEIILLADCVYYEESLEPLLDTLTVFLDEDKKYAVLSQEERDTPKQIVVWKTFLTELNKRFKVEKIPINEQHPIFSSPDIHLMKISR